MKKTSISIICGLASIIATIILYATILGNIFLQVIYFITLLGVLCAEAITMILACLSNGRPRKVAGVLVSAMMIPVSVILSLVYIVNFPTMCAAYVGVYCTCYIVVGVIIFVLFNFDENKAKQNDNFQEARRSMLKLRRIVKCIMLEPEAQKYKNELNDIEEKLHFTNDSVIAEQDETIYNMLIELQNNISKPQFDTATLIANISRTIESRNIMNRRNV